MKRLFTLIVALLPMQAFALEYRNLSLLYTDAPFTPAETAGISLLTSLDAVSGYPDGTYRPTRTLNRAEFLKIVLASYPKVRVSPSDADSCFPDIAESDWFSQYVCLAKKRGMVSGYPDGEFKPERPVNYAEALKILGELYGYVAYSAPDEEWYAGYVRAAEITKTALPSSMKFDRSLTRGQMARLAAAFRAYEEGELETYRLSEKSFDLVIAQEIGQKLQEQEEKKKEAEQRQEDEPEEEKLPEIKHEFPARSHFLLLGSSDIIASGFFHPRDERVIVENVTVKLREETDVVSAMYLVDETGHRIVELKPDLYDDEDLTWKSTSDLPDYAIPADGKTLGIEVLVKARGDGGIPEQLLQAKWISMNVSSADAQNAYQLIASNTSFPPHQTAAAEITSVTNNSPAVIDLEQGDSMLLAEFEIGGRHIDDAQLRINHVTFTIAQRFGVVLSNFVLGAFHSSATVPCSTEGGTQINCYNLPAAAGMIENDNILLQLWGTVDVDESTENPILQIDLRDPGVLGTATQQGVLGHLRWTDGQGAYNWTELPKPMATGSVWK